MNRKPPLIHVRLDGPPIGKGRPRFGKGRVFTPPATVKYEQALGWAGKAAMVGSRPLETALIVVLEAYMPIPASWSNAKRASAAANDMPCVGKPDCDNIAKLCDGLNKIVWVDDAQIVSIEVDKIYSDSPRLEVSVWEWGK